MATLPPRVLRPASPSDLEALERLEEVCFQERRFRRDHLSWILHHPSAFTILDEDRVLRGAVMALTEAESVRILSVAVAPPFRRRGVGRALMEAAEAFARNRGARALRLEVGVSNTAAIALYRSLGFRASGLLYAYYSWGEDAHEMVKTLARQEAPRP